MDGRTLQTQNQGAAINEEKRRELEKLALIKSSMPATYEMINSKAKKEGGQVFVLVRQGIRGTPNCFWAMEAGHVVGTPFEGHPVSAKVAAMMVQFGSAHVCILADIQPAAGGAHGTH